LNDGRTAGRSWRRIAPTFTGTVIPANSGELCDFRLNFPPAVASKAATAGFENHRWASRSDAVYVQGSAADVYCASNSEGMTTISPTANLFVAEPRSRSKDESNRKSLQDTPHPISPLSYLLIASCPRSCPEPAAMGVRASFFGL
jgi:hypothetical protein